MHQEPNFEGNFEIRCAGNACISIFVRSMNASEPKMFSFIGPVSILVWALCPVVNALLPVMGFTNRSLVLYSRADPEAHAQKGEQHVTKE